MGSFMPKKIIYYVQRYRPRYEAISKEVFLLATNFHKKYDIKIIDLHLDGLFKTRFSKKIQSHHFVWYPFMVPYRVIKSYFNDINHIYTSLGDLPYLGVLSLKNTILTAAASCTFSKMRKKQKKLRKLKIIIVETQKHMSQLLKLGIKKHKIRLIRPPVDVNDVSPLTNISIKNIPLHMEKFKILYASCPIKKSDFKKRGIYLLFDAASVSSVNFVLAWRKGAFNDLINLINNRSLNNITVRNEIIYDMGSLYRSVHATIIPYTKFDNYLKLIPNSAIESLAVGKPVLVSSKTELASIIKQHKCGVVFEPDLDSLVAAIEELRTKYSYYQKNCRKTAQFFFSKKKFLNNYEKIYDEI
jgi:glycosyltransferase involved in cell wall biosynthesis